MKQHYYFFKFLFNFTIFLELRQVRTGHQKSELLFTGLFTAHQSTPHKCNHLGLKIDTGMDLGNDPLHSC